MKRIPAFLLVLSLIFILAACGAKPAEETVPTTAEQPVSQEPAETTAVQPASQDAVFRLDSLPDIGSSADTRPQKRWHKSFQSSLIPRKDYGRLIPFIGDAFRYLPSSDTNEQEYWETVTQHRYGLMTVEGKIVVDAVFSYIRYEPLGSSGIYIADAFTQDEQVRRDWTDNDAGNQPPDTGGYVIAQDGSWSVQVPDGLSAVPLVDSFAIACNPFGGTNDRDYIPIYGTDGKVCCNLRISEKAVGNEVNIMQSSTGVYSLMEYYEESPNCYDYFYCYFDKDGKPILTDRTGNESFCGDTVVVQQGDGFVLVDRTGKQVLDGVHEQIHQEEMRDRNTGAECFFCSVTDNGKRTVYDRQMQPIRTLDDDCYLFFFDGRLCWTASDEDVCWDVYTKRKVDRDAGSPPQGDGYLYEEGTTGKYTVYFNTSTGGNLARGSYALWDRQAQKWIMDNLDALRLFSADGTILFVYARGALSFVRTEDGKTLYKSVLNV